MLGLWLGLQVIGLASSLHTWLHPDQASPGHHCVVTLVSHGQVHQGTAEVPIAMPEPAVFGPPAGPIVVLLEEDHWLWPERGPPVFVS